LKRRLNDSSPLCTTFLNQISVVQSDMTKLKSINQLVIVTGTPGTGKSTITNKLCTKLGWICIDWHEILKKNRELSLGYDQSKKCYDLNLKVLEKEIKIILKNNPSHQYVFDSHIAHLLPSNMISLVVVMKCSDIGSLKKRLTERGYSKKKVEENIECEIFEVCLDEVIEAGLKYVTFDSEKKLDWKKIIREIELLV